MNPFRQPQSREEKIAHATRIIQDVADRVGSKYGQNNILKYMAIFAAGEFMRESMESGEYETFGENYRGTKQQALLRRHIERGVDRLVQNGLDSRKADQRIRSRLDDFERLALDALIWFVEINKRKKPEPAAFFTALKVRCGRDSERRDSMERERDNKAMQTDQPSAGH